MNWLDGSLLQYIIKSNAEILWHIVRHSMRKIVQSEKQLYCSSLPTLSQGVNYKETSEQGKMRSSTGTCQIWPRRAFFFFKQVSKNFIKHSVHKVIAIKVVFDVAREKKNRPCMEHI